MSRKKPGAKVGYMAFDVFYVDGSQTSNRRMPKDDISTIERDASIRNFFEAEDQEIENRSGRKRAAIKSIEPSRMR